MTKKAPEIRFKGFEDDWEQRKLGEVFFQTSKYVNPKESNLELWSLTVENGLTPKTERYNREFLVKKEDQFKSVDHNEFIYNPMNMTLGAVDLNLTGKTVAVSGYYITMLSKDGFDSKYFSIWLKSPLAIKMYKLYATGSLIERQRVQFPTLSQIKSSVPQIEEQTKIGSFFKQLDDTIALHQRKLEQLELIKQALLQKLFPKAGETIPELRLRGFNEPLGQEKFEKVLKIHPFRQYLAESVENGRYEIVQQGDNPIIGYANGVPFQNFDGVTLFGDHTVSLYKPSKPFFIATDGVKILSGEDFNGKYLYTMLERFKPKSQGYKRHLSILKSEVIYYTKNSTEQVKIGELFSQFDRIITLNQNKIKNLTKIKNSLLQKMFI
ncbi:restriction endonuclease subunit S [Jeotgalibaca arthritidis]|uniref:Type I restriction modification DNA specificity domain-containing protein n=1 Tax=Jeotgalibaca arthritidis TaxID=1868794 RepID=A0A6G7K721_9LACT|nr:restriction endonuclease subunit S [Jeotgalibaca arthritidis]QII81048.1 hypothetical protein G7057_00215 [Jeotgalibaca arthritidis]